MKKVTAFIGSARRNKTYRAVLEIEKNLKLLGEVDFETVFLHEYHLEFCRGCALCFDKGENHCPLKDDRDALLEKMANADGVIFATPSYAFQVSARMKNFLDRVAFLFHRPRFFGKTFSAVVTQGIPSDGGKIRKYLEQSGGYMGFGVVKGSCLWTLEPMSEGREKAFARNLKEFSERFHKSLHRPTPPVPSFLQLMLFRMSRTGIRNAGVRCFDYYHFREMGWFESDYYYESAMGPVKKLAGRCFDMLGRLLFGGKTPGEAGKAGG